MSARPPDRPDAAARSDRRREQLEALRRLQTLPRARTKEETEAWIREVRLMGEESTLHLLEKLERAWMPWVAPPPGDDDAPRPRVPRASPEPVPPGPESQDPTAANRLPGEPRPRRPSDPTARSRRRRKQLEALRRLQTLPRTRTKEEIEAWIREVRLRREELTRHLQEKFERAGRKPIPPDSRSR